MKRFMIAVLVLLVGFTAFTQSLNSVTDGEEMPVSWGAFGCAWGSSTENVIEIHGSDYQEYKEGEDGTVGFSCWGIQINAVDYLRHGLG